MADGNGPYLGVEPHVNRAYATKLEETVKYFHSQNDTLNAGRTWTVQNNLAWVSELASVCITLELRFQPFCSLVWCSGLMS